MHHMDDKMIAKQVYNELCKLDQCNFMNWISKANKLVKQCGLNTHMACSATQFKVNCKKSVYEKWEKYWLSETRNSVARPLLRLYKTLKYTYKMETYLHLVSNPKYRKAISSLRCSSHTLAIERGRHSMPVTPIDRRTCSLCGTLEDEKHFVLNCIINKYERGELYNNIVKLDCNFNELSELKKFHYLFASDDVQILTWFGKFIYKSLLRRRNVLDQIQIFEHFINFSSLSILSYVNLNVFLNS